MDRTGWMVACWALLGFVLAGCQPTPYPRSKSEEQMFGAASMRVHPTFTQIKDWTGDGKPDGIEVVLEFEDQFDEPTRAAGTVRFELWSYRQMDSERAGRQLTNPWTFSIAGRDEQAAHWNPAVRGYSFQLPFDKISTGRTYVLTAQFNTTDGGSGRLFDQLILEPSKEAGKSERRPERAPTNGPGHSR
jgi:hypothetical protein